MTEMFQKVTGAVPIGGIVPWAKNFTGVPTLPEQFLECDGSVISDAESPLNGQTLPNLNGNNNYLRGGTTSGSTGGALTHTHTVGVAGGGNHPRGDATNAGTGSHTHSLSSTNHEPPYYQVVWIMRIK
jgi:hypothetical protein